MRPNQTLLPLGPAGTIPQADPKQYFAETRGAVQQAIARVFERGSFILGQELADFEVEFADYLGARHAIGVASGTQAISLALAALGIGPGDEVITASMTFPATATAIEAVNAVPVFVDVDPNTRCIDPICLAAAIGPATTAIVPVHLHGFPAPMEPIMQIAARHGLAVVEDCAQSHGAITGGRRTGTFGHAAAFSFYPTKNLGAAGDAGAVTTNDPLLAVRVKRLRNYGCDGARICVEHGVNGRLDELQAAILRVLLPGLDRNNAERRRLAAQYRSRLVDHAEYLPPDHDGAVYHQFAITLPRRDQIRSRLLHTHGIETGIHYSLGVHRHPHFLKPGVALPVTDQLASQLLSLPIQPQIARDRVDVIADAVLEALHACQ
jgi:dTDP-3-amino-3,4,6-trideoxy-alpha-D-glucose transaminase